jgi:hypothetical protein
MRLLLSFTRASQSSPTGRGWAHELKHDGYRLQIHVRDGRVKLYTRHVLEVMPVVAGRNTLGCASPRGFECS